MVKSIIKEIYKVELCNEYQKNKMFLLCNSPKNRTMRIVKTGNAEDFYHL